MKSTAEEIERLLAADVFVIAAHAFMATFEGTKLGKQLPVGSGQLVLVPRGARRRQAPDSVTAPPRTPLTAVVLRT